MQHLKQHAIKATDHSAASPASGLPPALYFKAPQEIIKRFATILQAGFYREAVEGQPVIDFLSALPGFSKEYVTREIQTIFLNGDAIDDLDQPLVGTNCTIALSAAMPGLAGAILRKNSPHAALRRTKTAARLISTGSRIVVRVKLFNTIATDMGRKLCAVGVQIKTADLVSFLDLRPTLLNSLQDISLMGEPLSSKTLIERVTPFEEITVTGVS